MKVVSHTKNWLNYNLITNCFILSILMMSCTCQTLKIQYLPFFDSHSDVYRIMDTANTNPFPTKSMYYIINQSSLSCINTNELDSMVNNDTDLQKQLKSNHYRISILFYKESDNLTEAIKQQSRKLLTLCNDDIVAEYIWEKGKIETTLYYKDGQIKGSENIKLQDMSEDRK